MKDLFFLAADKQMRYALEGALSNPKRLGVRPIDYDFSSNLQDGGTRSFGPQILNRLKREYAHGLILFDLEGSGAEGRSAIDIEREVEGELKAVWGDDAKAIVIAPELEICLWGADNALQTVLTWKETQGIRDWLRAEGYKFTEADKPLKPKEAMNAVLRHIRMKRSADTYKRITEKISLTKCTDPAFIRLRTTLQHWFPIV